MTGSKKSTVQDESAATQRIDKWLWAARFFKTRSLAAEAVSGGKVHLEGNRVKPSKLLQAGAHLHIRRGEFVYDVVVKALNAQRRPASEAALLYEESAESIQHREDRGLQLRDLHLADKGIRGEGRPNKKQRRAIIKFRNDG